MPRTSVIENHPKRAEIEAELLTGTAYRSIAKRFGISPASVFRYKERFVGSVPKEVAEVPKVQTAKESLVAATLENLSGRERFIRDSVSILDTVLFKLQNLLDQAENGPEFNDQVLTAIAALEQKQDRKAGEYLEGIKETLSSGLRDQQGLLRDIGKIVTEAVKVFSNVGEGVGGDRAPAEVRVILVEGPE